MREVRPLIEEGGRILNEAKGIVKGLDPDGHIAANAKHKTVAREATPEEYRLADLLKDLAGDVTQCIVNAKRKLEDMPHAKKELNPLWGLLNEPLFQIMAAVGLLLAGVLNLVGRLVSRASPPRDNRADTGLVIWAGLGRNRRRLARNPGAEPCSGGLGAWDTPQEPKEQGERRRPTWWHSPAMTGW